MFKKGDAVTSKPWRPVLDLVVTKRAALSLSRSAARGCCHILVVLGDGLVFDLSETPTWSGWRYDELFGPLFFGRTEPV